MLCRASLPLLACSTNPPPPSRSSRTWRWATCWSPRTSKAPAAGPPSRPRRRSRSSSRSGRTVRRPATPQPCSPAHEQPAPAALRPAAVRPAHHASSPRQQPAPAARASSPAPCAPRQQPAPAALRPAAVCPAAVRPAHRASSPHQQPCALHTTPAARRQSRAPWRRLRPGRGAGHGARAARRLRGGWKRCRRHGHQRPGHPAKGAGAAHPAFVLLQRHDPAGAPRRQAGRWGGAGRAAGALRVWRLVGGGRQGRGGGGVWCCRWSAGAAAGQRRRWHPGCAGGAAGRRRSRAVAPAGCCGHCARAAGLGTACWRRVLAALHASRVQGAAAPATAQRAALARPGLPQPQPACTSRLGRRVEAQPEHSCAAARPLTPPHASTRAPAPGLQVYWVSYSHLKDKSMFSWADHEVFEEL
jgi:hypothetical protein